MTRDIVIIKTELNRWCGGKDVEVSAYDVGEYIFTAIFM
jgi:hypothetical protein